MPLVYGELRRMARRYRRRQPSSHTLQATALIHEAGHQVAHICGWNGELAATLERGLREQAGASGEPAHPF